MFDDDVKPRVYVPPGWPQSVRPPDAPGWLHTVESFLLDVSPPEYRGHAILRRHPVVLARLARAHVEAQLAATRATVATMRSDLDGEVEAGTINHAMDVLHAEESRIVRVLRAVKLVEEAVRDVRFVPRL